MHSISDDPRGSMANCPSTNQDLVEEILDELLLEGS